MDVTEMYCIVLLVTLGCDAMCCRQVVLPTPQFVQGCPLPYITRSDESVVLLLNSWIMNEYGCVGQGCSFVPPGCTTREGKVRRPDRWSHFLDHWYSVHMVPSLEFVCTFQGKCSKRACSSQKRLTEHFRSHLPKTATRLEVGAAERTARDLFSTAVGPELDHKVLARGVVWPETEAEVQRGVIRGGRKRQVAVEAERSAAKVPRVEAGGVIRRWVGALA